MRQTLCCRSFPYDHDSSSSICFVLEAVEGRNRRHGNSLRLRQRAAEDTIYAFNDLHAIMAFLGAGYAVDAERTLKAMRAAAAGGGDNAYVTRKVGLPLAEAFIAFEAGRYGEAVEKIAATRAIAQRFGGSHAQRDVLTLTALHAALRGGFAATAEAFAAERVAHKPQSPWAGRLARQAREVSDKARAA
jgi:hypothetical protein